MKKITLLFFVVIVSFDVWASGLKSLDDFLRTATVGQADFTQVVTSIAKEGQAARVKTSSGTFAFARPGRFRFDYRQPFAQTIVADGQTLWLFDADLNQVSARKQAAVLGTTPAALIASAADLEALQADFVLVEAPDKDGLQWVSATPKRADSALQSVRLGFQPGAQTATGAGIGLHTLEIFDTFGQRSVLTFQRWQTRAALPAGTFDFKPPAGADVIRQ